MRAILLLVFVFLFIAGTSHAQHARVKKYTAPLAGKVVLGTVEDKYNAQVYSKEMPEADANADEQKLQEMKKQIKKKSTGQTNTQTNKKSLRTTSSPLPPKVALNFVADSFPGIPPDNYTAVSKGNKVVAVMNSLISVHDATTGAYLMRKGLAQISSSVSLYGINNYRYDPKVVYDPGADRFICVILNGTVQFNYILIGFSASNDPTGAWNFYKFYGDYANDTTWFDYPAISVTQNEFFLTGNKVRDDSSWQAGFTQSVIYQVRKADGYAGAASLTYQIWDSIQYDNKYLRCLYPLNPGDSQLGPSQYFLSNRDFEISNDSMFIVQIPDTIGSIDSTLTVTPVISSCSYGIPPDAGQPDTALTLATNDDRILGGFIQGNEMQFVCTTADTVNGGSCIYHGVISNFKTAPVLTGRLFIIDTLDFGYPNISFSGNIDGLNQSIISFEYSGLSTYPGFGAILFDGNNYSPMLNIISGDSSINELSQQEQRWGDYSGSQPDWNNLGTVWAVGIYGRADHNYGNYMAKLSSPYNVSVPVVPAIGNAPSKVYPNPAFKFVRYEFTVAKEQNYNFFIYDIQGREVDKLTEQYCHDGKNIIDFNIAPLAPGTYFLKATGADGENITVHTFIRQ